jgi:hypothetical protein
MVFLITQLQSSNTRVQMPWPHMPDLTQKIPSRIAIYAKDVQNITERQPQIV